MGMTVANALAPVFFVMLLGYFAGKRKIVENRNVSSLNSLLMNFALPAGLFTAIVRTPQKVLMQEGKLVLALAVSMLSIYGITWLLQRSVFHIKESESAVQALTVAFPNCASIGLPLLGSVFGSQSAVTVALGIAVGAIFMAPITLVTLESASDKLQTTGGTQRFFRAVLRSIRRPVVVVPFAAALLALLGVHIPELLSRMLTLIGQSTAGLALFLTGLILSAQPLCLNSSVLAGVALKNLLQVGIAVGTLWLFGIHGSLGGQAVLLLAIPAGFFGTVFGLGFGVVSLEASSTLVMSSLLSMVTLPLAVLLTKSME
jgi:predicted permease